MKSTLLLFVTLITLTTFAQTKITGTVSDDLGQLPLANIIIKNSKQGVSTDDYGGFSIEAKSTDTLQFSYLGYKTEEVVVGNQKNINFTFESYEALEEVVINTYAGSTSCSRIICRRGGCSILGVTIIEINNERTNSAESIKLYPNPSKDGIFTISLLEDVSEVNIIVADMIGRIILIRTERKLKSNNIIDLSCQPSGIYIVNISSNGEQIVSKKVIKI